MKKANVVPVYKADRFYLTENPQSNPKLFADDTSLFTILNYPNTTAKQLCDDLDKIKELAFHWKMSFNPDPSKKAEEVIIYS